MPPGDLADLKAGFSFLPPLPLGRKGLISSRFICILDMYSRFKFACCASARNTIPAVITDSNNSVLHDIAPVKELTLQ